MTTVVRALLIAALGWPLGAAAQQSPSHVHGDDFERPTTVSELEQQLIAVSEREAYPRFALMFDPLTTALGPVVGVYPLGVDFQWAFHEYVGVHSSLVLAWVDLDQSGDDPIRGFMTLVEFGLRVLPMGDYLDGVYIQPEVAMGLGVVFNSGNEDSGIVGIFGGEVGYEWTWENGFAMSVGGGAAALVAEGTDVVITPKFSLLMGYSWGAKRSSE